MEYCGDILKKDKRGNFYFLVYGVICIYTNYVKHFFLYHFFVLRNKLSYIFGNCHENFMTTHFIAIR